MIFHFINPIPRLRKKAPSEGAVLNLVGKFEATGFRGDLYRPFCPWSVQTEKKQLQQFSKVRRILQKPPFDAVPKKYSPSKMGTLIGTLLL